MREKKTDFLPRTLDAPEAGCLNSSWGESESHRRAKFYRLTKAGERQLAAETEGWQRIALAIRHVRKAI